MKETECNDDTIFREIAEGTPSTSKTTKTTSARIKNIKEKKVMFTSLSLIFITYMQLFLQEISKNETDNIVLGIENGIEKASAGERGFGVFALKTFEPGEYIAEYKGELMSKKEGIEREQMYGDEKHSYMYFFQYNGKSYW